MSFLAPLFLFGALAVGAPILFHLIRRHTKDVVPFSSLMFLRPSPPRVHRRSRLENLWLLLLRCLILLLLAIGFARPFLQKQDASKDAASTLHRTVLLVDTSASMRREDLWAQAKNRAAAMGRQAAAGDDLALVAFDRSPRTLIAFEQWRETLPEARAALIEERLNAITPGWGATALGTALIQATELLESLTPTPGAQRSVIVVSDLQEGTKLDGLQGFTWPKDLSVSLERITAKTAANASLAWVSGNAEAEQKRDDRLTLRVSNSPDAPKDQYQLQRFTPGGQPLGPNDAYVPAGQTRTVRLGMTGAEKGERIVLTGDAVDFDNTLYIAPTQLPKLPVLFVGNEAADVPGQSVFYLQRALETMRQSEIAFQLIRGDAALPTEALQSAQLLVLGEGVTAPMAEAARAFAERGHVVILPMVAEGSGKVLEAIVGKDVPTTEAETRDYALLAQIDFQHPIFAPFADPRFSDFTKIHFWRHRKVDLSAVPDAKVVAKFDSGDPAIFEIPIGSGSVVAIASSWRPADSQLALSTKFIPMLNALLERSSRVPRLAAQYFVGDDVTLSSDAGAVTVRTPGGGQVEVKDGRFTETSEPGLYQISPGERVFAVNLSPEEGRLAELPADRLTSIGVPLTATGSAAAAEKPEDAPRKAAAELENRQKLWRWLLAGAFVILLLETWLAGRLARPSNAPAQAATP